MKKTIIVLFVLMAVAFPNTSFAEASATASAPSIPPITPVVPAIDSCATCTSGDQSAPAAANAASGFEGTVSETMNSGGYTYVLVDTGTEKKWAAAPECKVKVGDKVGIPEGAPMPGFTSKTLNRKFDLIFFVGAINVGGAAAEVPAGAAPVTQTAPSTPAASPAMPAGHPQVVKDGVPHTSAPATNVDLSGIKKVDGGKTIAEIYAEKVSLSGKEVKVRGKVVKFNAAIMGKNWFHIKDGTGDKETSDLTVTTAETVKVGDTVVVLGVLAVDKDFGAGYKYVAIIEDAKVTKE